MNTITKKSFPIVGMHCASCAKLITRKLQKVEGVTEASVNYANETAYINIDSKYEKLIDVKIEKAVKDLGYKLGKNVEEEKKAELVKLKTKTFISLIASGIIMTFGMIYPILPMPLTFVIALFIQIVMGKEFYLSLWSDFRNLSFGMNSLVAIGTTAAFLNGYFETSVTIIALILLGRYLESKAKMRTTDALKKLIGLKSDLAMGLKVGDVIRIKPGQQIPIDGVVVSGETYIDESMITGESRSVKKMKGDSVVGGTINKNGSIEIKVTKVGADTVLSQIIQMVAEAQGSRAEVQNLVDTISFYFVPGVLAISLVAFFTFGLGSAIAVLVVACPCAMGLATPTAIMVAMGKGAASGILIKDIGQLEILNKVNVIMFDKTGTLTVGKPVLTNTVHNKYLQIAGSLESLSEHPIGEAIVNSAKEAKIKLLNVTKFKSIEGSGIEGYVSDKKYFIGKKGGVGIGLYYGDKLLSEFEVNDPLKKEVPQIISELTKQNIVSWMISGDNEKVARETARKAGIRNVIAGVMPNDKALKVKELMTSNIVAFVGDGVNDAPALTTANVGIAMGTGTDIAIESAGITLLNKNFGSVLSAVYLSRRTMSIIKQNLFWAFGYNIVLIPVAFLGLLNPMLAAFAMAASSISVVGNSLRLKAVRI